MLIIQCLLSAIALILLAGFAVTVAYLHGLHQNQNRGAAAQLDYLSRILGEPNEGVASNLLRDLSPDRVDALSTGLREIAKPRAFIGFGFSMPNYGFRI
ncbi:MAG: hypothetical protein A3H25_14065 [Sphingomonadales bacterium RIFCSPLOWO2_12_FULL_63_15]|nr:MAG: hypothetical protein A3H25_14065 [Sphingomonadales bacterium RIFCSPLOWO2_12_FULL_63_15]